VLDSDLVGPQLKSRVSDKDDRNGYAVAWDGPEDRMIFVQSQNKNTHGLGDANFVTAPGRNAEIINLTAQQEIYRIDSQDRLVKTLG
jgi:lysine/ornithine N-monooxygenase